MVLFPLSTSLMKYYKDKSLFPYNALFDSGIKSEGSRFLRQLLVVELSARPSATHALKHNWILSSTAIVWDNDMNILIYVRMIKNESYRRLYI